jgi:GPH family glycoside/pentoside/hexuronide:cation symporter
MSDESPSSRDSHRSGEASAEAGKNFSGTDLSAGDTRLSVVEKVGYGLGDTASNFYWKLFENFQLYFYTDVFGISAAAAATMFFVTKLWDAINDPLIGFMADRTQTAWGRFRPYLVWGSLPFAVTGILTFYTPDLGPTGKLIYAYITYTLVFTAYTFVNIPYGALMGVISSNSIERTSVSTYRFVMAFLGGLIVQKFTEPLVEYFGKGDLQVGFFWTVACYAITAMFLFLITFALTRERVQPQQKSATHLWKDVEDLFCNRPWVVLMVIGLFQILAGWTRGSAIAYYFTYYVGSTFGDFLAYGTIASIAGMLTTKYLAAWLGKCRLMIVLNLLVALLMSLFYFFGPEQVFAMYALHMTIAFISGPIPVLLFSMYADAADFGEWKNGRRATGLVFSAATFSQKLGGAFGSALPGLTLALCQFQAPIEGVRQTQSATAIQGIILMMSLIPAGLTLLGTLALLFYNLKDSMLVEIETELKTRKQSPPPESND